MISELSCPLCLAPDTLYYWEDRRREYRYCQHCQLVFVPPRFHLSRQAEKAEYDKHRNSPEDDGYCRFLQRLTEPLRAKLVKGDQGLDFGCGPGSAMPVLFLEKEARVQLYDPFYANDSSLLCQDYDFVIATEVVEHLREPAAVWETLRACIKPRGYLGVMTKMVIDQQRFQRWHYKNDPTHICFYSRSTLHWIASQWRAELEFVADDAFIFRLPG